MKTSLRTLLYLALIVWLGAEIFFPVVAAVTFNTLIPDTHLAGSVVGQLLRILHGIGIVCSMLSLALLALAPAWAIYKPRHTLAPMVLLVLMLAVTVYSQYGIIPAMERDRIAAGGAIDMTNPADPHTSHFNMLHRRSEHVEGAVMLLGIGVVILLAYAESAEGADKGTEEVGQRE